MHTWKVVVRKSHLRILRRWNRVTRHLRTTAGLMHFLRWWYRTPHKFWRDLEGTVRQSPSFADPGGRGPGVCDNHRHRARYYLPCFREIFLTVSHDPLPGFRGCFFPGGSSRIYNPRSRSPRANLSGRYHTKDGVRKKPEEAING